jgi:hypothetical protein
MADFTNAVFQLVVGAVAVLMTVVAGTWVAVVFPALHDRHAH